MKKIVAILTLLVLVVVSQDKQIVVPEYKNFDNPLINNVSQLFVNTPIDYKEAKEQLDILIKQEEERKAEEERLAREAEEAARRAEEARLAALPVNFDEVFNFIDVGQGECQSYIDADYVTMYFGDYYHHNTNRFMQLFNRLSYGKTVIIGGQTYTCVGVTTGQIAADYSGIYAADGTPVANASSGIEIITCKNTTGGRYIAYLQ